MDGQKQRQVGKHWAIQCKKRQVFRFSSSFGHFLFQQFLVSSPLSFLGFPSSTHSDLERPLCSNRAVSFESRDAQRHVGAQQRSSLASAGVGEENCMRNMFSFHPFSPRNCLIAWAYSMNFEINVPTKNCHHRSIFSTFYGQTSK